MEKVYITLNTDDILNITALSPTLERVDEQLWELCPKSAEGIGIWGRTRTYFQEQQSQANKGAIHIIFGRY